MKKLILLATLFCASYSVSAHTEIKPEVKFSGDLDFSGFCQAVLEDDVRLLKRSIRSKVGLVATNKEGVLKRLVSQDGMQCNGADLMSFSIQRQASNIQAYLAQAI
ncbi:DUF3718 domain-containing protein [Alteromonadaceae bacterium M269]|nr:DUF3718 domain-containing protein [Alteromonadaceae bacterium M269]